MIHIEVTQDSKSLFSFDTEEVVLYQSRALSPLYKTGENKPYTIAPSRYAQTAIYFEEYLNKKDSIVAIEWADKIKKYLKSFKKVIWLKMEIIKEGRKLKIIKF
jgi:hypothetical protein